MNKRQQVVERAKLRLAKAIDLVKEEGKVKALADVFESNGLIIKLDSFDRAPTIFTTKNCTTVH